MPLGAALGGAAIAGVGSVAAGAMSASAQKKAARTAADSSAATADKNNALYREIYGQNKELLTPFSNNGLLASNALTALLLGSPEGGQQPDFRAGLPSRTDWANGALSAIGTQGSANPVGTLQGALTHLTPQQQRAWSDYLTDHPDPDTVYEQRQSEGRTAQPTVSTGGALDAFDRFRQGTNYQWRFNEGMNALQGKYATRGALDSGAAEKAKITYGQNIASGELSNYMNLLASQQAMGLSAAGAVAGVGTSYAGNVAAQNTNASNTAANAALIGGQATANMWGTVGQTAGQVGGALFQYGMGQMQAPTTASIPNFATTPQYWNNQLPAGTFGNGGRGF